jgi:hypothetical protein
LALLEYQKMKQQQQRQCPGCRFGANEKCQKIRDLTCQFAGPFTSQLVLIFQADFFLSKLVKLDLIFLKLQATLNTNIFSRCLAGLSACSVVCIPDVRVRTYVYGASLRVLIFPPSQQYLI